MWERGNEEGIEHACTRDVSAMTTVLLSNGIRLGEGATTRMARLHKALAADTEEVDTPREPPLGGGGGRSSAEPERAERNTRTRHGEPSTQRTSAARSARAGKRHAEEGGQGDPSKGDASTTPKRTAAERASHTVGDTARPTRVSGAKRQGYYDK